jgi:tetratricopeptide (TPR) repeat protein
MVQTFASKSALSEAVALINSGHLDKAETICRSAVGRNPDDINMVALLGAILLKSNQIPEAEKYLRQAIQLAPSFAKPHEDLGHLLVKKGQPEEAAKILEKATRLDPKLDRGFFSLGQALAMLGKGKEADEAFEKSFELNPERKTLALAAEHQKEGRWDEAEQLYREVLRSNPTNVDAMRLLGNVTLQTGRIYQAERLFRRAVSNAPDFVQAQIDLGCALKKQSRLEEAIAQFNQAISLEPDNVLAQYLLAATLSIAAQTYQAVEAYQKVLELAPKHTGAMLGLGHVLKTVGRQEEAIEAYRNCIRQKPHNGEIYWSLANLKTYKLSDEDIREMESMAAGGGDDADKNVSEESRINFLFALAKAYEDRGEYGRAWEYYAEGNHSRRMGETYDPVRDEVMNDEIVEVFNRDFLAENTGLGHPSAEPIFVVGLPRSGSTLIEQILASHSQVEGTSELPYAGSVATSLNRNRADGVNYPRAVHELEEEHFKRLGGDYLELARIHRTEGKPFFIDQMPNNFPTVGFIHLILPNAKIIDARRYPLDSCLSSFRQLFARGQSFTYDLTEIGEYFIQYQRMMDYWHDVLPGRCLTVQYEEVVTDFETQVRRLLEYCDLPFEESCINFHQTERPVRTASSEQVRQPVYSKSVNFWRNHEEHLAELIEVLEPVLPRYRQYESINRPGSLSGS